MIFSLFAVQPTVGPPDGAVVDFQGFQIGIPSILISVKQKLRDAERLGLMQAITSGISGSLPSAAEFAAYPDGVEYLSRQRGSLIVHRDRVGVSVYDRLDQVLQMLGAEVHIVTSGDGVCRTDANVRFSHMETFVSLRHDRSAS